MMKRQGDIVRPCFSWIGLWFVCLCFAATPSVLSFFQTPTSGTVLAAQSQTLSTPTINWPTPSAIMYGTVLNASQLNASASVDGTFVYAPPLGTVLGAGSQTLSVTFIPTDLTDYSSTTASVTLVVNQAMPTIKWPTPSAITSGTALSSAQLNATASVAGSFVYTPAAGTVLNTSTGQTLQVEFTPGDATDYSDASMDVTINVPKAPLVSITVGPSLAVIAAGATQQFTATGTYSDNSMDDLTNSVAWTTSDIGTATITSGGLATGMSEGGPLTVTAAAGGVSGMAMLAVGIPPALTLQPNGQTAAAGQAATFTVVANGTVPITYQWQLNGINIAGATSSTYTTPPTTMSDSADQFTVVVTNPFGSISSSAAALTVNSTSTFDVPTYHNDNSRSGQNPSEAILTPANVNSSTFGRVGFFSVDGPVDAQPLYLSGVPFTNQGTHNVLYVATENDSVYALDAATGATLWQTEALGPGEIPSDDRGCSQVTPKIGITSTPVIDRTRGPNGAIYVVAMSTDGSDNYFQRLHALDLTTGAELFGGPTTIQATYPGTGDNSDGLNVTFDPKQYKEQAAILLSNGIVYTTWASNCGTRPYTGWVMAFDASTLVMTGVQNITPNGTGGDITMDGSGPSADGSGNIYLMDGAGTFDPTLNPGGFPSQGDFGNALLKLSTSGGMAISDYFAPSNTVQESVQGLDLGSGGPLVLPDMPDGSGNTWHLAVAAGKDSNIYVVSRDSMGKFDSTGNNIQQEIDGVLPRGAWSMPAYFNNSVYYGPAGSPILAFGITNAQLSNTPSSQTGNTFPYPGVTPTISAIGTSNSILWAVETSATAAVLHAYDATNLSSELYNSNQAPLGRDIFGPASIFTTPTIANGKVYIGMPSGVAVFGLLSSSPISLATPIITWPPPSAITYGTALSATQLNATASVPGSFVYTPGMGTVLSAGKEELSVIFTPTDTIDYASATANDILAVNQAAPTITWPPPSAITYGTALSATQLNATASAPGSFVYTPGLGTVLSAGKEDLSVTFTPTDTIDYASTTANVILAVNQATPPITWVAPSAITYGTALGPTQLNASASVTGGFAYTPANGTVLPVGRETLSVTFTPTDAIDYASATSNTVLTVNPAPGPLTVSSSTVSFGNVNVGTNEVLNVSYTNSGSADIAIANVSMSGAGFTASGLSAGQIVGPGTSVALEVTFAPASAGNVTGAVTITSDASNSPGSINLSGGGVEPVAHSVALTWNASPSTASGYNIYRAAVSGGPYTLLNTSLVTTDQYSDSTVQAGQSLYYVLTAVSSSHVESGYSNEVAATVPTP